MKPTPRSFILLKEVFTKIIVVFSFGSSSLEQYDRHHSPSMAAAWQPFPSSIPGLKDWHIAASIRLILPMSALSHSGKAEY